MARKEPNQSKSATLQYQTSQPSPSRVTPSQPEHTSPDPGHPAYTPFKEAFVHDQVSSTGPSPAIQIQAAAAKPAAAVAIIVCHGMGEQVRYETLGGLATALLRKAAPGNPQTKVTLSRPVDSFLARAEITWDETTLGKPEPITVHLYEAYWAPITEGSITYYETLTFLVSAACRGMKRSRFFRPNTFKRWMFGDLRDCEIKTSTGWSLLGVLVFLFLVVIIIFALGLMAASLLRTLTGGHLRWTDILQVLLPIYSGCFQNGWGIAMSLGFWLLVYVSYYVKYFIVQFAGDVAAYISPFKASKFQKVRDAIQKVGFDVGSLVYGFTCAQIPDYHKVVVVGHSLGSVLAYDTLNAMINLDYTRPLAERKDVIKRTSSLITFGSPLNKTAFLFRTQANKPKDPLREQMSAASQPLIVDYAVRSPHFRWTNIFSPMDIISGCLSYYDYNGDPSYPSKKVINLRDKQASCPIAAHVQYWNNDLLTNVLLQEVRRPVASTPPPPVIAPSSC